jgi:hypothetical protein
MSVSSVATLLDAAVLAGTSATTAFTAPYWRRQAVPAGETWVVSTVEIVGIDRRTSNLNYVVALFSFTILHHLSDSTDSNTYRTGDMQTDQEFLMDPNTYRVAGVKEVLDGGVVEMDRLQRIANIMEYTVSVQLSLVP